MPTTPPRSAADSAPHAPERLSVVGDPSIPLRADVAFFCSVRCPGAQIVAAYDAIRRLRDAVAVVAGGFHGPMERECLDLLLRGRGPTLVGLARSLERLRVPIDWRPALDDGKLLLVSPFAGPPRRQNRADAHHRNRVLAALADRVLIAHAEPGSNTEALALEALAWGSPVYLLDATPTPSLVHHGAQTVPALDVATALGLTR